MFSPPPGQSAAKAKAHTKPQPANVRNLPSAGTLGELLKEQLFSHEPRRFEAGFDSTIDIAKKLSPEKQVAFIKSIAQDCGITPKFADLDTTITKYTTPQDQRALKYLVLDPKDELYNELHLLQTALGQKKPKQKEIALLEEKLAAKKKQLLKDAFNNCYALLKKPDTRAGKKIFWEAHLKELFKTSASHPSDFYNTPIEQIIGSVPGNPNIPTKQDLQTSFSRDPDMSHSLYVSPKSGGKNDPGAFGGHYLRCYLDAEGIIRSQIMLCKQATDGKPPNQYPVHREVIAEVMGGRNMTSLAGDSIGSTYLAVRPGGKKGVPDDIYLCSIFFDKATMVHEAAHMALPEYKNGSKAIPDRPGGMQAGDYIDRFDPDFRRGFLELWKDPTLEKTSLAKDAMASLAAGNDQIHSENICLADFPDNQLGKIKRAFGIFDFGGAYRTKFHNILIKHETGGRFERGVHPESPWGKKLHVAYLTAYPLEVRRSKEFIDGIDAETSANMTKLARDIQDSVDYLWGFYGKEGFIELFASTLDSSNKILNPKKHYTVHDLDAAIEETKIFLINTHFARQFSIKDYGMECKLDHIRLWTAQGKMPDFKQEDLIQEYPLSFMLGNSSKLSPAEVCKVFSKHATCSELNSFLIDYVSLNKDNSSALNRKRIVARFISMLEQAAAFIDNKNAADLQELQTLTNYLMEAIHGDPPYDLNNADDTNILAQACDTAYHRLEKIYNNVADKTYFISCLSKKNEKLVLHGEPDLAQKSFLEAHLRTGAAAALEQVFTKATPSQDLLAFARDVFDDCGALGAIQILDANHVDLNSRDLEQWENLHDDTKETFSSFMEALYDKMAALTFDASDKLQPWLIQAIGYDNLKQATDLYGETEVKRQIVIAVCKLLTDTLSASIEKISDVGERDDLRAFLKIANHFIGQQNHLLLEHSKILADLEFLTRIRYRNPATLADVSQTAGKAAHDFSVLLKNPLSGSAETREELWEERERLCTLVRQDRTSEEITSETPRTRIAPSSPQSFSGTTFQPSPSVAKIAGTGRNETPTPQRIRTIEFLKNNGSTSSIEIASRITDTSRTPISDLMKLDDSHNPILLFSKMAHAFLPPISFFNDLDQTKDFFRAAMNEMKIKHGNINQAALLETLKAACPTTANAALETLARNLIVAYKNNLQQLDPYENESDEKDPYAREDYYPSDLLIHTAYHQFNEYKKLSGQEYPDVPINEAWIPEYAEALILVSLREKCNPINNSGWDNIPHLNEKIANFDDFYKKRFLGDAKINTIREVDEQSAASLSFNNRRSF